MQKETYTLQKEKLASIYAKTFSVQLFVALIRFLQVVYLQKQAYTLQNKVQNKLTSKQIIFTKIYSAQLKIAERKLPLAE